MRRPVGECLDWLKGLFKEEEAASAMLGKSHQLICRTKLTKKENFLLLLLVGGGAYLGWNRLQTNYGDNFVYTNVYNCGIPEIRNDQLCTLFDEELFGLLGMYIGMMILPGSYLTGRAAYNNHRIYIAPHNDQALPGLGSIALVKVKKPFVKNHPFLGVLATLIEGILCIPKYVLMGAGPLLYRMFTFLTETLDVENNSDQDLIIMVFIFLGMAGLGFWQLKKDYDALQSRMDTERISIEEEPPESSQLQL